MENKELSKNKYEIEYTRIGYFTYQILHYQNHGEQEI